MCFINNYLLQHAYIIIIDDKQKFIIAFNMLNGFFVPMQYYNVHRSKKIQIHSTFLETC